MTQMYTDPNNKASITHTEIIEDKLLIATDNNIQLLYLLRPNPNTNETNKINVVFMRRYNISEHFKPYKIEGSQDRQESIAQFEVKILKYETISMFDADSGHQRQELNSIKRVVMQIEVVKMDPVPITIQNVVIFDHLSSNFDAYIPIFKSN